MPKLVCESSVPLGRKPPGLLRQSSCSGQRLLKSTPEDREILHREWGAGDRGTRGNEKKLRGERPTSSLSPPLHAIGKSHTSLDVSAHPMFSPAFAAWYFLSWAGDG